MARRRHRSTEERGQTLVEYALIIAVVSLGAIAALTFLRDEITSVFNDSGSTLQEAGSAGGSGSTPPPPASPPPPAPPTEAPQNTSLPTIGGTPRVGQTLTAVNGTWTNDPTGFTFQWQRSCTGGGGCSGGWANAGTGTTYVVPIGDLNFPNPTGLNLRVRVTATNVVGSTTVASASVDPVTIVPGADPDNGTQITAANTIIANNADGVFYVAGSVQRCSGGSGATCSGGTWQTVNEDAIFAASGRSGTCGFVFDTLYWLVGSWTGGQYRVGSSGSATYVEMCT